MTAQRAQRFRTWLNQQQSRRDPVGHLAQDQVGDKGWPKGPAQLDDLHAYLDAHSACDGAHNALDQAWAEWQVQVPVTERTSWTATELQEVEFFPLTATELVSEGECSPQCLVAANEEAKGCTCRCGGEYHAVLARTIVDGRSERSSPPPNHIRTYHEEVELLRKRGWID